MRPLDIFNSKTSLLGYRPRCPHCMNRLDSFKLSGGETSTLSKDSPDPSLYDGKLHWAECGQCKNDIYSVSFFIASELHPGQTLVVDGSHRTILEDEEHVVRDMYPITTLKHDHFVKNALFLSKNGEQVRHDLTWIDEYSSDIFSFKPDLYKSPLHQANDLVLSMARTILRDRPWPWMKKSSAQLEILFPEPF